MGGYFSRESLTVVRFDSNLLKLHSSSGSRDLRIVFAGDTLGQHRSLAVPEGDIFIYTGSWCSKTAPKGEFDDFRDWLVGLPHNHKILVGNSSPNALRDAGQNQALFPGITYLQDRLLTVEGLTIYGTPWREESATTSSIWARSSDSLVRAWSRVPEHLDILVTMSPPKDILDHGTGSSILLQQVLIKKPRIHVFASEGEHACFCRCFEAQLDAKKRYLGEQEEKRPRRSSMLDLGLLEHCPAGWFTNQTLLPDILSNKNNEEDLHVYEEELPTLFGNLSVKKRNTCLVLEV